MPGPATDNRKSLVIRVSPELHARIKSKVYGEGRNLTDAMVPLLQQLYAEEATPPAAKPRRLRKPSREVTAESNAA